MMLHVLGHIAYDYIFDIPYHPEKGGSIYIKKYTRHYGGGGANICFIASHLGVKCKLVSSIGRDGKRYENYLKKHGVETHFYRSKKRMARAFIFNSDEQISYFYWGASEDMDKIKAIKSEYLHIAPSHPKAAIKMAENSKFFAFEPGQDIPKYEKNEISYLIEQADILFFNEFELKKIEREFNLKGKIVIVTLGKRGCKIYNENKIIETEPIKAVDPTGAGDAFKAAFWSGFLNDMPLEECCKLGNKASSYIIKYRGAQHALPKNLFMSKK